MRFSFLLATPVIPPPGVYKLHDLTGPNGDGIHGQIARRQPRAPPPRPTPPCASSPSYFTSARPDRFGYYCLAAGALSIVRFA